MKKLAALLMFVPAVAMLVGCGQIEETAGGIASDAASQVAGAAADEVRGQICGLVNDGSISTQDKELLGGLVDTAEAAGVPTEITEPLGEIAAAGDDIPAESAARLDEACKQSP